MFKNIIYAGLLGGLVLMSWTFVVNGILGFQASMDMKRIPAERQVYEVLKQHVIEPGRYICNPALTAEGRFPGDEPVFSILYGGVGHESAGRLMLMGLAVFFLAPMLAAWLLAQASPLVLSSYGRKLLFFMALGLLFALFADLTNFGIGRYPLGDALLLAANHLAVWTLVGIIAAWRIRPAATEGTHA